MPAKLADETAVALGRGEQPVRARPSLDLATRAGAWSTRASRSVAARRTRLEGHVPDDKRPSRRRLRRVLRTRSVVVRRSPTGAGDRVVYMRAARRAPFRRAPSPSPSRRLRGRRRGRRPGWSARCQEAHPVRRAEAGAGVPSGAGRIRRRCCRR